MAAAIHVDSFSEIYLPLFEWKKRSEATQTLRTGWYISFNFIYTQDGLVCKADLQTNTNRQGRLQYTAQLNAQYKYVADNS